MAAEPGRLVWLARRLSRMPAAEWLWRARSLLRIAARRAGWKTAKLVPAEAVDARWGQPWCQVGPVQPEADAAVVAAAQALLVTGPVVFGCQVPTMEGRPDWNADPVTGQALPGGFGLSIDFRHLGAGIDIKHAWELARHEWWVTLAQGWSVSRDRRCLDTLGNALDSWCTSCPYPNGVHWSSAIEHGVRLINWSLVWHLVGGAQSPLFDGPAGTRRRSAWLEQIYQHVRFVHDNLSRHTSSSNHLLGELAGILVAVRTWDRWADLRPMADAARRELQVEAYRQFASDGVNREQALSYHKFSLQFLLAAGLVVRGSSLDFDAQWWMRLFDGMAFVAALMEPSGALPRVGDSDDADAWRLAHQVADGYQELISYGAWLSGRVDLAAKCRSLNPALCRAGAVLGRPAADANEDPARTGQTCQALPSEFPDGGYMLMGVRLHQENEWRVLVDCGSLGYNRICAHGHADALAILVSSGGEPLLVDPGTYCYNTEPRWRRHFRGTAAHNTLRVDGVDQSDYGGSFLWLRDVTCRVVEQRRSGDEQVLVAWHDGYERLADPVRHWRRIRVGPSGRVEVEDWLECARPHRVEWTWQAAAGTHVAAADASALSWWVQGRRSGLRLSVRGPDGLRGRLALGEQDPPAGWVSTAFYDKLPASAVQLAGSLQPGERVLTVIEPVPPDPARNS